MLSRESKGPETNGRFQTLERSDDLPEQVEILRSIFASMAEAVVVVVKTEGLVFLNPAAAQLFGFSTLRMDLDEWFASSSLFPAPGADPCSPEERPLGRLRLGQEVNDREYFVAPAGVREGRWVSASARPIQDGGGGMRAAVIVFRDISERKRMERTLRASEAKFRALLEFAPDPFVIVDQAGRIVLVNDSTVRTFGYPAAELIGQPVEILLPEPLRGPHVVHRDAYFAKPAPRPMGLGHRLFARRSDGSTFPVEVSLSPLETHDGLVVMSILRDITDRVRAEQELEDRALELARSNSELEQFAYVASHDLQEPLRMIGSIAQLLDRRYQGRLDATADEFIGFALDGVARMQGLINNLLEYSRVSSQGQSREPVDCEAVVDLGLSNLRMVLQDTGAEVTRDPLPILVADASQLCRVFQNLIGNALKFHGPDPPRVHISANRQGDEWIFSVRDNGIGIEPRAFKRIFVMLQRLHGRDEYPGSGMGLSITKKIIECHGGRIWVESEPGRGSCFSFALPASQGGTGLPSEARRPTMESRPVGPADRGPCHGPDPREHLSISPDVAGAARCPISLPGPRG